MDIKEALLLKDESEKAILAIISKFTEDTGMQAEAVLLRTVDVTSCDSRYGTAITCGVEIVARL